MITPCLIIKLDEIHKDESSDDIYWASAGDMVFKLVWDRGWHDVLTGGYPVGAVDWDDFDDTATYLKIEIKDDHPLSDF